MDNSVAFIKYTSSEYPFNNSLIFSKEGYSSKSAVIRIGGIVLELRTNAVLFAAKIPLLNASTGSKHMYKFASP